VAFPYKPGAVMDISTLIRCGVQPTQARIYAEPLSKAMQRFQIDRNARVAAFIAQLRLESNNFTRTEENLFYTTPARIRAVFPSRVRTDADAAKLARNPKGLANVVYAGRLGNGDEASGDGWKYRGRGLIQLTGRNNYTDAATSLSRDFVNNPDLVSLPGDACLTAAWFWHTRKLNALADQWQINAITRAINGPAMLHAKERLEMSEECLQALL